VKTLVLALAGAFALAGATVAQAGNCMDAADRVHATTPRRSASSQRWRRAGGMAARAGACIHRTRHWIKR